MEFIGQSFMCYYEFYLFEFTTNAEGKLRLIYYPGNTVEW